MDYKAFYLEFLTCPGGPEESPYIYAFIEEEPSDHNMWMNPNLAGSYAPSSIRPGQPFSEVVEVSGSRKNATYALKADHWKLAKQYLLFGNQMPVVPLVVFLYRDYGLEGSDPDLNTLVRSFQAEFGYVEPNTQRPSDEYRYLYDESMVPGKDAMNDWFESLKNS